MRVLDEPDLQEIDRLLAGDEFFWLDLHDPADAVVDELAARLGWNPLAVEDAKEFDQRPKLDDYADHALLVFYGVHEPDDALVEVHLFVSGRWLVTVRRGACAGLMHLRTRLSPSPPDTEEELIYRVLDTLTDTFLPALETLDTTIDALEDQVVSDPAPDQAPQILALRRRAAPMARVAIAQRHLFASVTDIVARMPGLERAGFREGIRDVADHLTRIAGEFEGMRDRLATTLDLYTSSNANRLNEVTERLTLVATIFLPLSVVVGYFGQNLGWMTSRIDSLASFLIWGVGVPLATLAVIGVLFARAGLLSRR